jgi:hypothetical protein
LRNFSFTDPSSLRLDTWFLRSVFWGKTLMTSTDMPAALVEQPAQAVAQAQSARSDWAETALTLLVTAAAILFVSFVAVVTGLV